MVRKHDPKPTYDGPKAGDAYDLYLLARNSWNQRQRRNKVAAEARTAAAFAKPAALPASVAHDASCDATGALPASLPATFGGDVTNPGIGFATHEAEAVKSSHEKLPERPRIDKRGVAVEWQPPNLSKFPGTSRAAADSEPQLWYQQMTGNKWELEMSDWNKQTRRHRRLMEDKAVEKCESRCVLRVLRVIGVIAYGLQMMLRAESLRERHKRKATKKCWRKT
jgi:hypothetical protein